jgi:hypothetical protein
MGNENLSPAAKRMLQTLQSSLSPFEKFVAKYDIEETLPLVSGRRKEFFAYLAHAIRELPNQIIPIAGQTGYGKTFVLWELKKAMEIRNPVVFLEVPDNAENFYYRIYTKIITEIGSNGLRDITSMFADMWGASELKFGLYRVLNIQKILAKAKETKRFVNSIHKQELEQCMKVIISHAIDTEKMPIAERWLLGDKIEVDNLNFLEVEKDLSFPFMAEEIFKLIVDCLPEGPILIFDDIDKNWTRYNIYPRNDEEEPDWTEPSSQAPIELNTSSSSAQTPLSFFEQLTTILDNIHKIKIIITLHMDNIDTILSKFPANWQYTLRSPIYLPPFKPEDAKEYFLMALSQYRKKYNLDPVEENKFFPLSEKLILMTYDYTKGNPREIIRGFQKLFDAIVIDEMNPAQIEQNFSKIFR